MFMDDAAIVEIMCGITWPNSCMDYCGASLVVISFTDSCLIPVILIQKDKSRINWNGRLLCGMSATGDIFRFCGILVLISFHFMTVANPYWNFSNVYFLRLETALLFFAETWGSWVSDARMYRTVQFGSSVQDIPFWYSL